MPVTLSPELYPIFFEQNAAPVATLDMLSGAAFRALRAALKLGLFDALEEKETATVAELARSLKTAEIPTSLLLRALESYGYVTLDPLTGKYANTATTSQWLLANAPSDYATVLEFWGVLVHELWDNLEESITTGQPGLDYFRWLEENPRVLNLFQRMLANNARLVAPEIAELVPLAPTEKHLLDIGGSHAIYSRVFCEKNDSLQATIFDLPNALATGQANVAESAEAARINFKPGDLLNDDLGTGYDLAFLFSIVHLYQPAQNQQLLQKVAAALQPGGRLLVVEHLADVVPERPVTSLDDVFLRTFSLNLYHLMGGQLFERAEMLEWLEKAGFKLEAEHTLTTSGELLMVLRKN